MRNERAAGVLVIAGSLAMLLVMGLHPTAHDLMSAEITGKARVSMAIHALALAVAPAVFLGLFGASRRLGQPVAQGVGDHLGPVLEVELLEDVLQVELDGVLADHQRGRDLAIAGAGHQQLEHFRLARGQRVRTA